MQRIFLGLLIVVLASPVAAQNRPALDDPIGEFRIPNPLPPCVIESVATRLAQAAKVLVGFENIPECASDVFPLIGIIHTPPDLVDNEDLTGMTARQALNRPLAIHGRQRGSSHSSYRSACLADDSAHTGRRFSA